MRYGVTKEFYEIEYGGGELENFERTITKAEHAIDQAAGYRIKDINDWGDFAQRQIRLAICAQASHIETKSAFSGLGGEVSSYSIGDVSVNLGGASQDDALESHYKITAEAISFLRPTGLLDRRLR